MSIFLFCEKIRCQCAFFCGVADCWLTIQCLNTILNKPTLNIHPSRKQRKIVHSFCSILKIAQTTCWLVIYKDFIVIDSIVNIGNSKDKTANLPKFYTWLHFWQSKPIWFIIFKFSYEAPFECRLLFQAKRVGDLEDYIDGLLIRSNIKKSYSYYFHYFIILTF